MPPRAFTQNVAPVPVPGHPNPSRSISRATQLRHIAEQLRAMVECGSFALCFEDVRTDMATLPESLMRLAQEMEPYEDVTSGYEGR